MDQYKSSYLSTPEVPSSLRQFFETFYKISDTPEAHDKYVDCFTKDAVIIMARGNVEGCDGILSLRHKMWSAVSSRSHHPTKIFPFARVSESEAEVMLYGTVEYGFKEGGRDGKDWAARALLVNSGSEGEVGGLGGWRLKFYQVYLDTAANK
ncbi:MAG: hypothetical protein ALECFALPRED_008524 [Alectoria fallacina]|uniref:SnoaL-like domain-containing protein n=1 Tax=Alectoria fallacina TaxID=1903189 RepID=A0A8H3PHE1_9LECA|nr:MAG: hypothetical protein ALECFALPRED_008524 [Alectoria fallacina]